jgi:uroporphyrinogen-III decarboxylase
MKDERGFIVNLGHGVTPEIPMENVQHFVNEVICSASESKKHFGIC